MPQQIECRSIGREVSVAAVTPDSRSTSQDMEAWYQVLTDFFQSIPLVVISFVVRQIQHPDAQADFLQDGTASAGQQEQQQDEFTRSSETRAEAGEEEEEEAGRREEADRAKR